MPKLYPRSERVQELIARELAVTLQNALNDPRLGMVTILSVNLTPDMRFAKVNVNIICGPIQATPKESIVILNKAVGFLRHELAQRLKNLRSVPRLQFILDETPQRGAALLRLIESVAPPALAEGSVIDE